MVVIPEDRITGILNSIKWISGTWTACSVTCGRGLMFRNVDCTSARNSYQKHEYPQWAARRALRLRKYLRSKLIKSRLIFKSLFVFDKFNTRVNKETSHRKAKTKLS